MFGAVLSHTATWKCADWRTFSVHAARPGASCTSPSARLEFEFEDTVGGILEFAPTPEDLQGPVLRQHCLLAAAESRLTPDAANG